MGYLIIKIEVKQVIFEEYLNKHVIVKIGVTPSEFMCTELIVDDPVEFIATVFKTENFISSIQWWDRVLICDGSELGYGGARDPRAPKEYYFAETDIGCEFGENTSEAEYYEYLNKIKQLFDNYDLYPAFDIMKRGK